MTTSPFVHLHVHTYYSLLDGANPITALAQRAKALHMPAVAMTDHGNLFGAIEFYQAMHDVGVQPIIGCEAYLMPKGVIADRDPRRGGEGHLTHITLLARDYGGYQNLCRLSSIAHLDGFYYKPRIDKHLLAAHSSGLICLTGCLNGEIARCLRHDDFAGAQAAAQWLLTTFGEENVYFELMRHHLPEQDRINGGIIELARQFSRPLVATNDCHYGTRTDAAAHDALLCIQTAKLLDDTNRMKMDSDEFYFRSPDEMQDLFPDIPQALHTTTEIAARCHIEFDFKTYHFPKFEVPAETTLDLLLTEKTRAGFTERWKLITRIANNESAEFLATYEARLQTELDCITKMGFAGYFLIVADFIAHAKASGIAVGPGRGSAAGSLVAYCLKITDVDPLPFGLFFERFLNPERVSMPDMDIDFCVRRREEVIAYVQKKYGNVGQIITFGKMKAKAVVRDVGRVMGIPYGEVDRIAKLIPMTLGITLADALVQEPQINALADKDPRIAQMLTIAQSIEGFPRHASTHAAGVVISDRALTDFLPLYRGSNEEIVTQFDMKAVEKIGLIKFDFLGLKTMTILYDAMALIAKRGGPAIVLEEIPLTDADVFAQLSDGDTAGIFQLESSGMTDLVVRLKPSLFEDIVALVALFRPGPLGSGMVDDFINRKHGRTAIEYPLPQLEPILRDSYGVIVYQEQVMQIASTLASYSLGEADLLRRAMGKKKADEMAQQKARFLDGARKNNVPAHKAEQIFDLMEKFAGYGFNKSHSVAYALISYHTAWFKTHYPTEYFAAVLSNEMGNTDKVLQYLNDAKAHDITILPPDCNECERDFTAVGERAIRFGFAAVKNVGEAAIDSILETRVEGGPFTSLFDFCSRVDTRRVNRRVLESLIKCGTFDSHGVERATLFASLDTALEYGATCSRDRASGQESLFGGNDANSTIPPLTCAAPWPESERLTFEKEAVGFYITGHPLAQYTRVLAQCDIMRTDQLAALADKQFVRVGGVVAGGREIMTKRGDRMGFATIEDVHGTVEVVVFSDIYAKSIDLLKGEAPLCVGGTIDRNEETIKIIAQEIVPLDAAPTLLTKSVHVHLNLGDRQSEHLEHLKKLLVQFGGVCPTYLHLTMPNQSETTLALPSTLSVQPSAAFTTAIESEFGAGSLRLELKPFVPPAQLRRRSPVVGRQSGQ